jgi:hypothetical protein
MPGYQWIMPMVTQAGICKAEELDAMRQGGLERVNGEEIDI